MKHAAYISNPSSAADAADFNFLTQRRHDADEIWTQRYAARDAFAHASGWEEDWDVLMDRINPHPWEVKFTAHARTKFWNVSEGKATLLEHLERQFHTDYGYWLS